MLTRRAAIGGLSALAACKPQVPASGAPNEQSQRVTLPNGGHAWLSFFDTTKIAIDHIAVEAITGNPKIGDYYPASKSPAFTRLDESVVLRDYRSMHSDKVRALINCSFFERYDPVTELSFPIKQNGKIITGGSSPYGPCINPVEERYKSVTLKALVWNERAIQIADFDHKTGGILNDAAFPNALVTYDYKDHPANVLAGDPVGRYQLMATKAAPDGMEAVTLLVLTITKGRMVDGASVLAGEGVAGTVLTIDGGPSTHLWTKNQGEVITTESKTLPHYLGFRAR